MSNMNRVNRPIVAAWFRDWMVFRSWIWGLALVGIAGPLMNLLNAVAGPQASSKITALLLGLYNNQFFGDIVFQHGHLIAMDYRPKLHVTIHGAPTAGVWMLVVSMTFAVLLATVERHAATSVDLMNEPVRRRDWVTSRYLFGSGFLFAIGLVRGLIIGGVDIASPYHVSFGVVLLSFFINTALGLGVFAVAFVVALLAGNTFIAWTVSFLFLNLPLAVGSIFTLFHPISYDWKEIVYRNAHRGVMGFSPTLYTQYGNQIAPVQYGGQSPSTTQEFLTAVQHPWTVVIGSLVGIIVAYVAAQLLFSKTKSERFSDWFISPIARHFSIVVASIEAGAIFGQIEQAEGKVLWLPAAVVCYFFLWAIHHWLNSKRRRPQRNTQNRHPAPTT